MARSQQGDLLIRDLEREVSFGGGWQTMDGPGFAVVAFAALRAAISRWLLSCGAASAMAAKRGAAASGSTVPDSTLSPRTFVGLKV